MACADNEMLNLKFVIKYLHFLYSGSMMITYYFGVISAVGRDGACSLCCGLFVEASYNKTLNRYLNWR